MSHRRQPTIEKLEPLRSPVREMAPAEAEAAWGGVVLLEVLVAHADTKAPTGGILPGRGDGAAR